jgi:hypothetical protein
VPSGEFGRLFLCSSACDRHLATALTANVSSKIYIIHHASHPEVLSVSHLSQFHTYIEFVQ